MSLFYKQTTADGGIRLERCTDNVPDDGKYYVFEKEAIVFSTTSLKKAQAKFNKLKPKIIIRPAKKEKKKMIAQELVESTLHAKEIYWHYSSQHRSGRPKR